MSKNFTINFYEIMGVEPTATMKDIRKQYAKLVMKYHPDKNPDTHDTSLFELIQRAYETIGNEQKRKEYDFYVNNVEKARDSDFISMKAKFKEFNELAENEKKSKTKEQVKIDFDRAFNEMDARVKLDRTRLNEKLTQDEIKKRMSDLALQREQEDIELAPTRVFDPKNFNIGKFNAMFDAYKESGGMGGEMTRHEDVGAFNGFNAGYTGVGGFNGGAFDDTEAETSMFGKVNFGHENRLNMNKLRETVGEASYVHGHRSGRDTDDYQKSLRELMARHEKERDELIKQDVDKFDTSNKKFQFMHEIGVTDNMLDWENNDEDNENLVEMAKRLLALQQNNTNNGK